MPWMNSDTPIITSTETMLFKGGGDMGDKIKSSLLIIDPNDYSEVECDTFSPRTISKHKFRFRELPKELQNRADELTKDIFKYIESQR